MNLIKLALWQRTKTGSSIFEPTSGSAIFDIDDIISPVRKLGRSGSYFYTRADRGRKHNIIQNGYKVLDSLASIKLQSTQLISLTVTSRSGRVINNEVMLFDTRKIFEIIDFTPDPNGLGGTTSFKYEEERENYFVQYEVTDSLASIYAQTQGGGVIGGNWQTDVQVLSVDNMTTTQTPTGLFELFKDGQLLTLGTDYTRIGTAVTNISGIPWVADTITAIYQY